MKVTTKDMKGTNTMKITKKQLKQIIKEELSKTLREGDYGDATFKHYSQLKNKVAQALEAGPAGGDWFVDGDDWGAITIPTNDDSLDSFKQEIQDFMDEYQLGRLEDLGVDLAPYERSFFN